MRPTGTLLRRAEAPLLFAAGLLLTLPFWNAKGDDAFIVLTFVRNFLAGNGMSINPGEPVYGFTSPAWFFLLSGCTAITGSANSGVWLASALSLAAFIIAFRSFLPQLMGHSIAVPVTILAVFLDPWFQRWAFSGQEITFKLAVAAWSLRSVILLLEEDALRTLRQYAMHGAVFTVALYTRPEFVSFLLLTSAFLVVRRRSLPLLIILVTAVLLYGPWVWYCISTFGLPVPHTIWVKAGSGYGWHLGLLEIVKRFGGILLPLTGFLVIAAGTLLRSGPSAARTAAMHPPLFITMLWAGGMLAGYIVTRSPLTSMYYITVTPFITAVCVAFIVSLLPQNARALLTAGLSAAVIVSAALFIFWFGEYSWLRSDRYDRGDDERYIRMAETMDRTLPPDARIAVTELGVMAYFSHRTIIDLGGIATPAMLRSDRAEVLHRLAPTHAVLYGAPRDSIFGSPLRPLLREHIRRIGGAKTEDVYTLYEVLPAGNTRH